MQGTPGRGRVTAVLGPTNTGKTFLAVERMLGHRSGMIGFPLRLLARENYDRIVAQKGTRAVALVTGEEKIVPPGAVYFVCTVESMPLDRRTAFLAVDEIQMAADPERGHVFTERLLTARGIEETIFLGAETARPLIRQLVPGVEFVTRPRFSSLSYSGHKKVTRLPPRSAVVAFSIGDVYRLAELVRRQRGGTAVVLGALSPRARNAQVGMYQAGEVDYLVATDAIGMGLNMDVRHVAFSALRKFDGQRPRRLLPAEIGQIAGRAGRHMSDGTFGTTGELGPMEPELVEAVEEHRFDPLAAFSWRNPELDFGSLDRLLASLERPPPHPKLVRGREGEDHRALRALARDETIAALAARPDRLRILWDVCQIPDFRKTLTDSHTRLLAGIFGRLVRGDGGLPADWVAGQLARLDRTDGDIDALTARIAGTRIWTYVSYRSGWLDDPGHWQERARALEDKLSDALHDRLTQRFVDRRSAALVRRMREGGELLGAVTRSGEVLVEGEYVGRLEGFRFRPDAAGERHDARPLLAAAQRVLPGEIGLRVDRLAGDADEAFTLDAGGRVLWHGDPVARLAAGRAPLTPRVEPLPAELLEGHHRERMRLRLEAWLAADLGRRLGALFRIAEAAETGAGRGLAYQLGEWLGLVPRFVVREQVAALSGAERRRLAGAGMRIGSEAVFVPAVMGRQATRLRALLWAVHAGRVGELPPGLGRRAVVPVQKEVPAGYYAAVNRLVIGGRAVGVEQVEQIAAAARRLAGRGPFAVTPALLAAAGGDEDSLTALLGAMGYRRSLADGVASYSRRPAHRRPKRRPARPTQSPFARLSGLVGPDD